MNERSRISQSGHRPAVRRLAAAHQLGRFTTALFVLAFMMSAHIPSAQGQPPDPDWPSPSVHLLTHIPDNPEHICPGDELVIYVFVNISDIPPDQRPVRGDIIYGQFHASGVPIEVRGAAHGSVAPSRSVTRWLPSESSDPLYGNYAPFVYNARDPGDEELRFWTDYAGGRGATLKFTVDDCDPRVSTIFRGAFNGGFYRGVMEQVQLNSGSGGGYEATGTLQWTEQALNSECDVYTTPGVLTTQATIHATVSGDALVVNITYEPIIHSVTGICPDGTATIEIGDDFPPDQVQFSLSGPSVQIQVSGYSTVILEWGTGEAAVSGRIPAWVGSGLLLDADWLAYLP